MHSTACLEGLVRETQATASACRSAADLLGLSWSGCESEGRGTTAIGSAAAAGGDLVGVDAVLAQAPPAEGALGSKGSRPFFLLTCCQSPPKAGNSS